MHTHPLGVITAAAACVWVTGIPALRLDPGCRAARVYEQHKAWGTHHICHTHSLSLWHSHIHFLSKPPAILLPLECQIIRLCNLLKASLKSNALSFSPSSSSHLLFSGLPLLSISVFLFFTHQLFLALFLYWIPSIAPSNCQYNCFSTPHFLWVQPYWKPKQMWAYNLAPDEVNRPTF